MKLRKRLSYLSSWTALLIFTTLLLVACGDNTAAPATTSSVAATTAASSAVTTAASTATTAAAAGAATTAAVAGATGSDPKFVNNGFTIPKTPVALSIWADATELTPFYQKVTEEYRKLYPNVTFEIISLPAREFEQKLAASIPSDTAGDILQGTTYAFRRYVENNLLPKNPAQVTKIINTPGAYPKELTDTLLFNNEPYGMPLYQGRHAIFYNTDYFKAAGLDKPPATMDELTEQSRKLVKAENGEMKNSGLSLRISGGGSGIAEKFLMYLYPNGGDIVMPVGEGKYRSNYNNEAGKKTLKMYIDMLHKYKTDDPKVKRDTEGFQLGATAMFARESNVIGDTAKKAPNLKYDTVPMPKGVRWGDLSTPVNLYVSRNSKNADVAWDFVLFTQREEFMNLLISDIGWIPQRQDYTYAEALKAKPQFKGFTFKDPAYKLYTVPVIGAYDEIQTKFAERLSKAFLDPSLVDNDAGIAKVLEDAAKETDDILKKAKLHG